jgi:hypothetical protein
VRLVEVKACKDLWVNFRREDRRQMREAMLPSGGSRWVVNVKGRGDKAVCEWVAERDWP